MARLLVQYNDKVKGALKEQFAYKNDHQIPKITKISLNMGVGEAAQDSKKLQAAHNELTMIAGQKAVITKAKHSVASFKLREGQGIGVKVTLRGKKMYEFLDRLVNIVLPRVRDFRGISQKFFDGNGNFSFGLKEQIVFPEVDYNSTDNIRGLNINIITTAKTDKEAASLLLKFGIPLV